MRDADKARALTRDGVAAAVFDGARVDDGDRAASGGGRGDAGVDRARRRGSRAGAFSRRDPRRARPARDRLSLDHRGLRRPWRGAGSTRPARPRPGPSGAARGSRPKRQWRALERLDGRPRPYPAARRHLRAGPQPADETARGRGAPRRQAAAKYSTASTSTISRRRSTWFSPRRGRAASGTSRTRSRRRRRT